jgi:DNA-binding response OmpR family regulator
VGAGVTAAPVAHAAVDAVRNAPQRFDVAVLDLHLPDCRGLGLLAAIRRLSPGTRVLLMTALDTTELCNDARALGAERIVGKPFDLDQMASLVVGPGRAA